MSAPDGSQRSPTSDTLVPAASMPRPSRRQGRFERAWRWVKHHPVVDSLLGLVLLIATAAGVSLIPRETREEPIKNLLLKVDNGWVNCVCFSPDGQRIAASFWKSNF